MFITKHTLETTTTPAQIWQVWQDAENWKNWDREIELSRLDGPFQTGTSGWLKLRGSPLLTFLLTHVEPYKRVVQETKLSLAKVVSIQTMNQVAGKTQVTFQIEIRGPLAFFFACWIGRSIKKKIPIEMEEMIKKVNALTKKGV